MVDPQLRPTSQEEKVASAGEAVAARGGAFLRYPVIAVVLCLGVVVLPHFFLPSSPRICAVLQICLIAILAGLAWTRERVHADVSVQAKAQAIAEAKRVEELQISFERSRVLLENAVDGIITINAHGIIESFNPACEAIFQYRAAEVLGKNVSLLMPEPHRSAHDGYLQRYLQARQATVVGLSREVLALRKNGDTFPMSLSMGSFEVAGQVHFCGIVRDISNQKHAQIEIEHYTADLERSNKELDDFAYIASHDLKEPVRGIYNHAELLKRDFGGNLDDKIRHRVERITCLSQHAGRLIDDLLNYSRLGRADLSRELTDLTPLVQQAKAVALASREEEISIEVAGSFPKVACDRPYVIELLLNLISNAIKYNEQKYKRIEIGTTASLDASGVPVFFVRDNGIGIDPRFHDDIFRIFKRLHRAESYGGGTGSGLTFVKKIVERHGGKIWLESAPGQGSTFYFTLSA